MLGGISPAHWRYRYMIYNVDMEALMNIFSQKSK